MLSFSRTTGYAVLALGCIARWKGERVLSKTIHDCTGIPTPYLRKTLFALSKAGIVQTKRGYRGGFVLTRPPEEITFLEVVHAVEGKEITRDCMMGLPHCPEDTACPLRNFWQKERARIEAQLARVSLSDASKFVGAAWTGKPAICPGVNDEPRSACREEAAPSSGGTGTRGQTKRETRGGGSCCGE
jgi:Rrf2 family protein